MFERETILPLSLGLALSILVHLAVLPVAGRALRHDEAIIPTAEQLADAGAGDTPGADLVVEEVITPDTIAVDAQVAIRYRIANAGVAPTVPGTSWRDGVYLSRDRFVSIDDLQLHVAERDTPLQEGEQYDSSAIQFTHPREYTGRVYLLVKTDIDNAVDESPNEANNVFVVPFDVNDAASPQPGPEPVPHPKPEPEPEPEPEEVVALGRNDEPLRQTVAWIPYDAFEELIAQQADTIQPAVQTQADPVDQAPAIMDASNPAAVASAAAQPSVELPQLIPNPAAAAHSQAEPAPASPPMKQVEADSRAEEPAPPVEQVEAEGPLEEQAPPTQQTAATGPDNPEGAPADQLESRTAAAPLADSDATRQDDTGLPEVARSANDPAGSPMKPDPEHIESQAREHADAEVEQHVSPADQQAARSEEPQATRTPRQQDEAQAPDKDETGKPVEQAESNTLQPDPEGRLARAEAREGQPESQRQPRERRNNPRATQQPAQPSPRQPRTQSQQAARPSQPSNSRDEPRPTSAAREERESPPTQLEAPASQLRTGWVKVSEGLEVKTIAPRLSVIERMTSIPKDATFVITFDKAGRVVNVTKKSSTGDERIDSAIIAAAYQWQAQGKQLDESPGLVQVSMTFKR